METLGFVDKIGEGSIKLLIFETVMPVCCGLVCLTTMFTFLTLLLLPEEVGLDMECLKGGYCI